MTFPNDIFAQLEAAGNTVLLRELHEALLEADEYNPVPPTITVPSEIVTPQTSPAGATVAGR